MHSTKQRKRCQRIRENMLFFFFCYKMQRRYYSNLAFKLENIDETLVYQEFQRLIGKSCRIKCVNAFKPKQATVVTAPACSGSDGSQNLILGCCSVTSLRIARHRPLSFLSVHWKQVVRCLQMGIDTLEDSYL